MNTILSSYFADEQVWHFNCRAVLLSNSRDVASLLIRTFSRFLSDIIYACDSKVVSKKMSSVIYISRIQINNGLEMHTIAECIRYSLQRRTQLEDHVFLFEWFNVAMKPLWRYCCWDKTWGKKNKRLWSIDSQDTWTG